MIGISSRGEFSYNGLSGVGMYLQGDYADIFMENGRIYSRSGEINIGSTERPISVVSSANSANRDGIVGENISNSIMYDGDEMNLPAGIISLSSGVKGIGVVGRSTFVGVCGRGVMADLKLKTNTIKTKDGKGNLIVNGAVLNRHSLLRGY